MIQFMIITLVEDSVSERSFRLEILHSLCSKIEFHRNQWLDLTKVNNYFKPIIFSFLFSKFCVVLSCFELIFKPPTLSTFYRFPEKADL